MKEYTVSILSAVRNTLAVAVLSAAPVVAGFIAAQVSADQSFVTVGIAQAAKAVQPAKEKLKPRRLPGLSQSFVKKLQAAAAVFEPEEGSKDKPNPKKALQMLDEMARKMADYNPYEQVMVHTYYGAINYGLDNTKKAIEHFESLIALSPNLPRGTEAQYIYTLAQLYFQEDQTQKSLKYLKRWATMINRITSSQYSMFANVYYQAGKIDDAMANMLEAIRLYEVKGKIPKEEWLSFVRAIYYKKENKKAALNIVEQLIRYYPKMNYWRQLAGLYYGLEREDDYYRTIDSMYVMGGLKKEGDLLGLAGGFLDNDTPYEAAKVLHKGINKDKIIKPTAKNLELLANSWRLAQETDKALVEMQRAAKKSDDGDLSFNLARLFFVNDRYKDSVKAAKAAIKKGGLKRIDSVYLTLGQTYIELGKFDEAIKAFEKAGKDKRSVKHATQWMGYAKSEKSRQEKLKDS